MYICLYLSLYKPKASIQRFADAQSTGYSSRGSDSNHRIIYTNLFFGMAIKQGGAHACTLRFFLRKVSEPMRPLVKRSLQDQTQILNEINYGSRNLHGSRKPP